MTSISDVASASTTSTATSTSSSGLSGKNEIAGNFQSFLTLLTTQLQNQSPLDPLDTNQFTQQLVQFASVEQQLKTNDQLTSILAATKASSTATAANYVGLTVTADGSSAPLANGAASWTINPAKAAAKATVTIKDQNGGVVATKTTSLPAGSQTYSWDGKNAGGTLQSNGAYTISFAATDASGQSVDVSTELSGKVTGVDVTGTSPVLTVGTASIPLSSVKTISYN